MAAGATAAATPISTLRRRNSIDIPPTLTLHKNTHHPPSSSPSSYTTTLSSSSSSSSTTSSSASSADYELVSLKPASYTSLRDILPTTGTFVQSPRPPSFSVISGSEISIRNPLVKQAAWAYLQPMSTSSGPHVNTVFHRAWTTVSDAFVRLITRAFDCLFGL